MVNLKTDAKEPRKTIYKVTENNYFEQSDVKFPREFLLKFKRDYNVPHFIPVEVKKSIQKVGIEHYFFHRPLKLNVQLLQRKLSIKK